MSLVGERAVSVRWQMFSDHAGVWFAGCLAIAVCFSVIHHLPSRVTRVEAQKVLSVTHDSFGATGRPQLIHIRVGSPNGKTVTLGWTAVSAKGFTVDSGASGLGISAPTSHGEGLAFKGPESGDLVVSLQITPQSWGAAEMPLSVTVGDDRMAEVQIEEIILP